MRLGKSSPTDPPVRRIVLFAVLALFAASSAAAETRGLYRPPPDQPSYENSEAGLTPDSRRAHRGEKAIFRRSHGITRILCCSRPRRIGSKCWSWLGQLFTLALHRQPNSHAAANLVGVFRWRRRNFRLARCLRFSRSCDFPRPREEYPSLAALVQAIQRREICEGRNGTDTLIQLIMMKISISRASSRSG